MIQVTRRYKLSASHRLHAPQLSEGENQALYGKCHNPFGHGHNYEIEVSIEGPIDRRSGRAVDTRRLDELVNHQVLLPFNNRNLNAEVQVFQAVVPTTENLGREIFHRLEHAWREAFPGPWPALHKVRIAETPRNFFEVTKTDGQE